MTSLLYHAHTIGPICKRIAAAAAVGSMQALGDRDGVRGPLETVIRWDSRVAVNANRTINSREAVVLSRNKKASRLAMGALCPTTWVHYHDIQYPCLIRPQRHYAAHKFFVCHSPLEARRAIRACGLRRWYASTIIPKEKEYRIFIFQDHVLKVVRRFHDDPAEVAWNIANGGRSIRVKHDSWPISSIKHAIRGGRALGLDWFAADVIVTPQEQPLVLELNTAPGLERDATIAQLADVFEWAGAHPAPPPNDLTGDTWDSLIHPTLL